MSTTSRTHILIADDEVNLLHSMQFLFHRKGYRVTKAKTGTEALETISNFAADGTSVDLLITDIQMPGIDGESLVRGIRKFDAHLPILVMTGFGNKELLMRLMHLGCNEYIDKPFSMEQMETLVESMLKQNRPEAGQNNGLLVKSDREIARSIGHDLNNMIHVTLSQAEKAMDELDDVHPAKKMLARVLASSNAAMELTQGLFSLKKNAASAITGPVELGAIIETTASELRSYAPENIIIRTTIYEHPIRARVSAELMRQAILNLGNNAIDAMADGGTLTLTTGIEENHSPANGAHSTLACITVSDTGPGFSPSQLSKVFKEGFTTKVHGHGIGLLSVQSFVDEYKGWIEVKNGDHCGAEITVFFTIEDHL